MKKTLLLLVISMMALALLFSGCTQDAAPADDQPVADDSQPADDTADDGSWAAIQEKGYFIMGLNDTYAPMGFRDESNKIVGFDLDLAYAVAEELGVDVQPVAIDWDGKIISLNSGDIDVIWNGFSVTEERKTQVTFSDTYIMNDQIIVVLADSDINTKADLAGKTIGWQMGSSADTAVTGDAIYPELGGERKYANLGEALMEVQAGRIDAVCIDSIFFYYFASDEGTLDQFKVLDEDFGKEEMAVGLRLTDVSFAEKFNEAFNTVKTNGVGEQISMDWFGTNVLVTE